MAWNGSNCSSPMLGLHRMRRLLAQRISIFQLLIFCVRKIARLLCPFSRSWWSVLDEREQRLTPKRLRLGIHRGWPCLISLLLILRSTPVNQTRRSVVSSSDRGRLFPNWYSSLQSGASDQGDKGNETNLYYAIQISYKKQTSELQICTPARPIYGRHFG